MVKAKSGLLWIGTDAGLCSYDGTKFTIYNVDDGLPSNMVWSIAENEKGNLWIGCYNGGIAYFDGDQFKAYTEKEGLPSNRIRKLNYKNGILLIASDSKLALFDGKQFYFKNSMMQVMDIEDIDSTTYVISRAFGVFKLNYRNDSLQNFSLDSCSWHGSLFGSVPFKKDLLLFKNKKLKLLKNESLISCEGSQEFISSISVTWDGLVTNDGTVYLAQWGVNENNGGLRHLVNGKVVDIGDEFGVNSKQLLSLYYDEQNNILWVGTLDKGLYILFLDQTISYPNQVFKNSSIYNTKEVNDILRGENGNIWCLKPGGFYSYREGLMDKIYDINSFKALVQKHPKWKKKIAKSKVNIDLVMQSLNNMRLYHLHSEGKDIFISSDHGLFKYNTTSKQWKHTFLIGSEFYVDQNGELTFHHPYSYVRKYEDAFNSNNKITYKKAKTGVPLDVTDIVKYKGSLWYSSNSKGLIQQNDSTFTFYKDNNSLNEPNITQLKVIKDSMLLLSTQSAKVYGVSQNSNGQLNIDFKLFPEKDFIGNYVFFISYVNDKLFIGTNKGLNIYFDKTNHFYSVAEGYFHNEVLCSELVGQYIYLGTKDGITKVNTNYEIVKNNAQIELKDLNTFDSTFHLNPLSKEFLELNYDQNYISIDYDFPNLINSQKDEFYIDFATSYSDGDWEQSKNVFKDPSKKTIRFLNLSPGNYRVAVGVNNSHSNQKNKSQFTYFTISPPFWKTLPFYLTVGVSFILMILFLIRKKIEEITEIEKANRRLAEVRLEALKSQMNPHFTFNVMNSIQNYVIDNDVDNALYFIGSFSKLVRTTLDYSFKKSISLAEEVSFLSNYIEIQNMRFSNRIKHEINFPKEYADKIKLPPMMIQPIIENVFVHAFDQTITAPKLTLTIFLDEDITTAKYVSVVVSDNGLGRANNSNSTHISRAQKIIQDRLILLNESSSVDSHMNYEEVEVGTKVCLKLPLILKY